MALQLHCGLPQLYEKDSASTTDISPFFHFPSGFLLHFDPSAGKEGENDRHSPPLLLSPPPFPPQTENTHSPTHRHLLLDTIASIISPGTQAEGGAGGGGESISNLRAALASLGLVAGALGRGESRLAAAGSSAVQRYTRPGHSLLLVCCLGSLSVPQTMLGSVYSTFFRRFLFLSRRPVRRGIGKKWTIFHELFLLNLHLSNLFSLSSAERQSTACVTSPNN